LADLIANARPRTLPVHGLARGWFGRPTDP
jgi:hypothetical protein